MTTKCPNYSSLLVRLLASQCYLIKTTKYADFEGFRHTSFPPLRGFRALTVAERHIGAQNRGVQNQILDLLFAFQSMLSLKPACFRSCLLVVLPRAKKLET
jgi:hypothetical protein